MSVKLRTLCVYVVWPNLIREAHPCAGHIWRVTQFRSLDDPSRPATTDDHIEFTGPSGEPTTASPVRLYLDTARKGIAGDEALWAPVLADIMVYTDILRRALVERLHARIDKINKQKFVIGDTQREDGSWIIMREGFNKLYPPEVPA